MSIYRRQKEGGNQSSSTSSDSSIHATSTSQSSIPPSTAVELSSSSQVPQVSTQPHARLQPIISPPGAPPPGMNSMPSSHIQQGDNAHNFTSNIRVRNNLMKYIILVHCCQRNSRTLRLLKLIHPILLPQDDCTRMKLYFDFEMSTRCCALLLPLSLHSTQREYIRKRLKLYLRTPHELKFLIVLCDHPTPEQFLTELNMLALQNNIGFILSFSENETARYLESFTVLEAMTQCGTTNLEIFNSIRHVSSTSSGSTPNNGVITNQQRIENIFRTIPTISTTTLINVIQHFKSLKNLSQNLEQVNQALGVGEIRARLLQQTFTHSFSEVKEYQQKKQGVFFPKMNPGTNITTMGGDDMDESDLYSDGLDLEAEYGGLENKEMSDGTPLEQER